MLLVAVDPAGCAYRVAQEAASLAGSLAEPVVLMTAVRLPDGVQAEVPLESYAGRTAEEVLVADAKEALGGLLFPFQEHGVEVRLEVRIGPPVQAVLEAAEEYRPRILVLGTHGRTGIKRLVLGSVAEQILRRAPVPVLTVRTEGVVDQPSEAQREVATLADG